MDSVFKNNAFRILELFFEEPLKNFSARGIARALKLSHGTVLKYLKEMVGLKLILINDTTLYPTFHANRMGKKFMTYKRNLNLHKIKESGLINYIWKETFANTIILFGSIAKGEDTKESDIDIFVEAKDQEIKLDKYERIFNKEINLLFEPFIENLPEELAMNIINGVVLDGSIEWRRAGRNAKRKESLKK